MLLVPLSKIKVRLCFKVDVDLPFTVIADEVSCQKPDKTSVSDA